MWVSSWYNCQHDVFIVVEEEDDCKEEQAAGVGVEHRSNHMNKTQHTHIHTHTPDLIKDSPYAEQWEWFEKALSVWMLLEELWDTVAKADNNWCVNQTKCQWIQRTASLQKHTKCIHFKKQHYQHFRYL